MKILIIDTIGVIFNGNTLNVKGLGGSESSIIFLSKEFYKLGWNVTIINKCKSDRCMPGVFDNIKYIDLSDIHLLDNNYDIVISSRSVLPFLPNSSFYSYIVKSKYKAVWLHDLVCTGDEFLEIAIQHNYIDDIITLSDYHTNIILNSRFELLKNKIFQSRNGAVKYYDCDLSLKTKHFFIYNSVLDKGLVPLLEDIWPRIHDSIPNAKLFIIGGYYYTGLSEYDERKETFIKISSNPDYQREDIVFGGIMLPEEIAKLHLECGFMLYPASFVPETFGISSLESLLYKTPIITCKYGALEETAISNACYLLDTPIAPSHDYKKRIDDYVELVLSAYIDDELYNKKQNYCDIIETDNIYSWETIALQWKQHIYYKIGKYLSKEDYHKVQKINDSVARIFNRRFKNVEEISNYRYDNNEKHIHIILKSNVESILSQNYTNYTIHENNIDYNIINENDIIIKINTHSRLINNNSLFNYFNELHNDYDVLYESSENPQFISFKKYLINNFDDDIYSILNKTVKSNRIKIIKDDIIYTDIINNPKLTIHIPNIMKKSILIAIPTDKYILPDTFKSIYNLIVPPNYTTDFQYFYGYRIDQVRNIIGEYAKQYDYLFAVDSDIIFERDTLIKMLNSDKDIVSGIYIQRNPNEKILEVFHSDGNRYSYDDLKDKDLINVHSCGFGCVLVKTEIFKNMTKPYFYYDVDLCQVDGCSEDVYFCDKANKLGYSVWINPSIICKHSGQIEYTVT